MRFLIRNKEWEASEKKDCGRLYLQLLINKNKKDIYFLSLFPLKASVCYCFQIPFDRLFSNQQMARNEEIMHTQP